MKSKKLDSLYGEDLCSWHITTYTIYNNNQGILSAALMFNIDMQRKTHTLLHSDEFNATKTDK